MLVLLFAPLAMMAQMNIAIVNVQDVFNAMPDTKAATESLSALSQQYKAEYEMMQAEFNKKYAAFQKISVDSSTPQTIKDRRIREIQDANREIEQFLQRSNASLEDQKAALESPIYTKINEAIKMVGDSGGYTYIIDVSKTPVVYAGKNAIDVTKDVKKQLGIE